MAANVTTDNYNLVTDRFYIYCISDKAEILNVYNCDF